MLPTLFSDAAGAAMRARTIPAEMEDKWFIYFADGWLNLHRSWTGAHIFALRLDGSLAGVRVVDGWVSRDDTQYRWTSLDDDRERLIRTLRAYFGD